jgi:hypothetical protein
MAKILKDTEIASIVNSIICDELIDYQDTYLEFLNDISQVVANYCGGRPSIAEFSPEMEAYSIAFHIDDEVPAHGGVYKHYDTDVTWRDGREYEAGESITSDSSKDGSKDLYHLVVITGCAGTTKLIVVKSSDGETFTTELVTGRHSYGFDPNHDYMLHKPEEELQYNSSMIKRSDDERPNHTGVDEEMIYRKLTGRLSLDYNWRDWRVKVVNISDSLEEVLKLPESI